jgi:hypothetical protein
MGSRTENTEVCTGWKVDQERQRDGVEKWEGKRVATKEQNIERSH